MLIRMSLLLVALAAPCGDAFMHFPAIARPSSPSTRSYFSAASKPAAPVHGTLVSRNAVKEMTRRTAEAMSEEKGRAEFELNRGQAVDTLLNDYTTLYKGDPDFSIFTQDVVLRDVQGFTLEGIKSYRLFFKTITNLMSAIFASSHVSVVLMDKYGIDKSKIKLRWRIELSASRLGFNSWKKVMKGLDRNGDGIISKDEVESIENKGASSNKGTTWTKASTADTPMVIEGISTYTLDAKGRINQHTISIEYPSSPFSLAPLRELLPVRRQPGYIGAGYGMNIGAVSHLSMSTASVSPVVALQAADNEGGGFFENVLPKEMRKNMPKICKSDYDCNPGGYNFPLICADFVITRICIDPDDWKGGGLGQSAWDAEDLVKQTIPVKVNDGYTGGNGGYSGGGYGE